MRIMRPLQLTTWHRMAKARARVRALITGISFFIFFSSSLTFMASEERQVTSESVVSMSIGQLKTFLTKYGVPFADCVEKTELRVRAAETLQKLASQELKPAAAAAAAAPQPESQDGVQSVGKGGGDPAEVEKRPEQLAALEVVELLPQLARIPEISERRQITEQVYDIKMRGWKQDRRYRGMAHHLVRLNE